MSQRQRDTGLQAELVGGGPRWLQDPKSALTSPDRSKHPWLAKCTCGMFAAGFSRQNRNCEVVHGSGGHQTNWGFPRAFWPWKTLGALPHYSVHLTCSLVPHTEHWARTSPPQPPCPVCLAEREPKLVVWKDCSTVGQRCHMFLPGSPHTGELAGVMQRLSAYEHEVTLTSSHVPHDQL